MSAPKNVQSRTIVRCKGAVLILLITCLSILVSGVPDTKAAANVSVVSYSSFYESGVLYVVGEIQNNGNTIAKFPKVVGNFYNSSGINFYNASGNVYLEYLLPGRKCPFKILVFGSDAENAETLKLIVSFADTLMSRDIGIELISNFTSIAKNGDLQVNGTIKNFGTSVATRVSLIVTFYDGSGKVIGVSYPDQSTPENIEAGQIGNFSLAMAEVWSINRVVAYTVAAESSEYEFSQSVSTPASPLPTNQLSPNTSQSTPPSASQTLMPTTSFPTLTPNPTSTKEPTANPASTTFIPTLTPNPSSTQEPTATAAASVNSSATDYSMPAAIIIGVAAILGIALFWRRRKNGTKSASNSTEIPPPEAAPAKNQGRFVFISHVEEDAKVALAVAEGLEKNGYQTWYYERDSLGGPSYLLQTKKAVEESQAVVVIISTNSLSSNQVSKEVVRAHESNKPFVPLLLGITHVEFQRRQPEWQEAIGAAASISIPKQGVSAILPRVVGGLASLGVLKKDESN
jgi:hypothetical protein